MVAIDEGWSAWSERELKRNGGAAPDPLVEPKKEEEEEDDLWELEHGGSDNDSLDSSDGRHNHHRHNSASDKNKKTTKKSEAKRRWGKMKMMGIKAASVLKQVNQSVKVDPMERGRRELMEFAFGAVPLPQPQNQPIPFRFDTAPFFCSERPPHPLPPPLFFSIVYIYSYIEFFYCY
jgi:hypothetical protein